MKDEDVLGTIKKNGVYGIFGSWNDSYKKVLAEPSKLCNHQTSKKVKQKSLQRLKEPRSNHFPYEIVQSGGKDQFLFTLTDAGLIETTGGILQGMSGSPVIQNGMFAGAVTHMFVDEPEKGAGLFLKKMKLGEK